MHADGQQSGMVDDGNNRRIRLDEPRLRNGLTLSACIRVHLRRNLPGLPYRAPHHPAGEQCRLRRRAMYA
jgi:hypothetical protein